MSAAREPTAVYRRDLLATGLTLGTAAVAGCASNDGTETTSVSETTTDSPETATDSPTATRTASRTVTYADEPQVSAAHEKFTPRRLRVEPGTTVTWTNNGMGTHSVQSDVFNPGVATEWSYYSADLVSGNSASYTFEDPGVYEYYCTVHGRDRMCGVVLVGDVRYGETLPCEG